MLFNFEKGIVSASCNVFSMSGHSENNVTLKNNKEIITDEKKFADLFNSNYINIVEISSGIKPETISSTCNMAQMKFNIL